MKIGFLPLYVKLYDDNSPQSRPRLNEFYEKVAVIFEEKGVEVGDKAYVIGGGAKSKVWRQIVADTLSLTLLETENNDSSFGAAMCAGISVGFFNDFNCFPLLCRRLCNTVLVGGFCVAQSVHVVSHVA